MSSVDPISPAPAVDSDFLPAWARVAREVQTRLADMQVGERLPPEREFCAQLGVSRVTLRKAMESLHREGFLQTRRGGGTRLVKSVSAPRQAPPASQRLIGLLVPTVENAFISRIVRGAEAVASERGFHLAIAHDHGNRDYQLSELRRMAEGGLSGVAIYPDSDNPERPEFRKLITQIEQRGIPLVMLDRYVSGISAPSVLSDNVAGMYAATEHMILSGRRRLALLSFGREGGITDRERRRGFLNALEDYGLPLQPVCEAALGTRGHEESARQTVAGWLAQDVGEAGAAVTADGSRHMAAAPKALAGARSRLGGKAPTGGDKAVGLPRFDGIVCMQDNMAYGAFLALRDAGLDVPQDVSLVGYDNLNRELFQAFGLQLTSIDQPAEEIGRLAANLLIDRIEPRASASLAAEEAETADGSRARHLLLRPRLVVRAS